MRLPVYTAARTGLMATPALAADLELSLEIPRLTVAEYHRPYVAIWIEDPDKTAVKTLAVWYDVKLKNNEGTNWLKDMRQWWRKSGRELAMPADGLSSPTRAPGEHQVAFAADKGPLAGLPAGEYRLAVEAAREVGGREMLRIPFQWPPKTAETLGAKGEHELGQLSLAIRP